MEKVAKEIEEITEDLDLPEFDLEEVTLPKVFIVELMANQALQHIKTMLVTRYEIAANKGAHNDARVKELTLAEVAARDALRHIKRDYPEAIVLASELAEQEARQARATRERQ